MRKIFPWLDLKRSVGQKWDVITSPLYLGALARTRSRYLGTMLFKGIEEASILIRLS